MTSFDLHTSSSDAPVLRTLVFNTQTASAPTPHSHPGAPTAHELQPTSGGGVASPGTLGRGARVPPCTSRCPFSRLCRKRGSCWLVMAPSRLFRFSPNLLPAPQCPGGSLPSAQGQVGCYCHEHTTSPDAPVEKHSFSVSKAPTCPRHSHTPGPPLLTNFNQHQVGTRDASDTSWQPVITPTRPQITFLFEN